MVYMFRKKSKLKQTKKPVMIPCLDNEMKKIIKKEKEGIILQLVGDA